MWLAVFSTIHSRILLTECASESLYSVQKIAIHRIRLIFDSSNTLVYRLGPSIYRSTSSGCSRNHSTPTATLRVTLGLLLPPYLLLLQHWLRLLLQYWLLLYWLLLHYYWLLLLYYYRLLLLLLLQHWLLLLL